VVVITFWQILVVLGASGKFEIQDGRPLEIMTQYPRPVSPITKKAIWTFGRLVYPVSLEVLALIFLDLKRRVK